VAKESLLVAILFISGGKSLVFIVLAILLEFRVIIIIAFYIKLKRQLVTRYINASLDYKH
jgi:hypothetical protein